MSKTKRREYDVVAVDYSLLYDATTALIGMSSSIRLDSIEMPAHCCCRQCGAVARWTNPDEIPHSPRCIVKRMRDVIGLTRGRGERRAA